MSFGGALLKTSVLLDSCEDPGLDRAWVLLRMSASSTWDEKRV